MAEEILDIVDEKDTVVGKASYTEVHKKDLRHRIVQVFIQNKKGEILLQLRSQKKTSYPGFWTMSVGGHVSSGENYVQAAIREAEEELGMIFRPEHFTYHGADSYVDDAGHVINYQTFSVVHEGPFSPDGEEVEAVQFVSLAEIREMEKRKEKLHNEMLVTLRKYFNL